MTETPTETAVVEEPRVTYEVVDQVGTITMSRPDLRNVLSVEALQAMYAALHEAAQDDDVRVVVLTGSGNTFCAGADLKGASGSAEQDELWRGPRAIVNVLELLLDHPKPTIARVQGHVAGGGNGLVAACDLSVAAESAKFAFSEVRLGVAPAVISVVCLQRMNVADGFELLLTGERVSARRAAQSGLLNRVVADEALDAEVAGFVDQLRRGGPHALAATKELLRRVRTMGRSEAFEWTAELSASLFASEEAQAGMAAFFRREPAPWSPPA
ncbi:MAG: enoyl-CoA hydratase/isomerase family protein [Candidatus Nanopelagicales bacterium]